MITIREVAKEASVSVGTVSNVLNDMPSVKAGNKVKVLAAIKRLGYKPNEVARMFKTNISNTICLILPDITNPFYPEVARGVEAAAQEMGYVLVLANSERSADKEQSLIQKMSRRNADGLILIKPHIPADDLNVVNSDIPLVLVDYENDGKTTCDIVNVDDYNGALSAMELLFRYKHKKIGFIGGVLEAKSDKERFKAYKDALVSENISVDESYIRHGEYTWVSGYENAASLMIAKNRPTAIFASNDVLAIGAMKAARAVGLSVPDDISIIGYDDIAMSSMYTPQITTVHRPKYELGRSAMETLFNRIKNKGSEELQKQIITIDASLKIRNTVGAVRTEYY